MTNYLSFNPDPRTPRFVAPAGAVDAHCHIFGPGAVFPYADGRRYTPEDAPKEALFALRQARSRLEASMSPGAST